MELGAGSVLLLAVASFLLLVLTRRSSITFDVCIIFF